VLYDWKCEEGEKASWFEKVFEKILIFLNAFASNNGLSPMSEQFKKFVTLLSFNEEIKKNNGVTAESNVLFW
jgi:hypothetical protein